MQAAPSSAMQVNSRRRHTAEADNGTANIDIQHLIEDAHMMALE